MILIGSFAVLLARLFGVIFTAVMLSGDNAVVIAMAAGRLRGATRKKAIFWGAVGAVLLLLIFATIVTLLLQIPYFRVAAGLLLFWIAWKLVHDDQESGPQVKGGDSVWQAIWVIVAADVLMSLDNVLALIGVSGGNLWLLGVGLAATVPVVFWGSRLLIVLLDRWGWLVYIGAGLLAWIAIRMIFSDDSIQKFTQTLRSVETPIEIAITAAFVALTWLWAWRKQASAQGQEGHESETREDRLTK